MSMKITTKEGMGLSLDNNVQGLLLDTAASDFRAAYGRLTNIAHRVSEDVGGENERPLQSVHAHHEVPPGNSISLTYFAAHAKSAAREMIDALERISALHEGDIFDTLIDRALLGPETPGVGYRRLIVDDSAPSRRTTHVVGKTTGISLYLSINDDGQPYVGISTEDMRDRYTTGDGAPAICVNLNDAVLYDQEKEGAERTFRADGEGELALLKRALRTVDNLGREETTVRDRLLERMEPPKRTYVLESREEPEDEDPAYRWKVDVRLNWLRDNDGLTRMELVGGHTREEAEKAAEELAERFLAAGDIGPDDWPREDGA